MGAVIAGFLLVVAIIISVFYCCCRNRPRHSWRKSGPGSWQDLEGKDINGVGAAALNADSHLDVFKELDTPESDAQDNYTKYVPRTDCRGSPLTKSISPTLSRIMKHHSSPDPFADSQAAGGRNGPGYILDSEVANAIEMTVQPSSKPDRGQNQPYSA